jgi:hypothetical protein
LYECRKESLGKKHIHFFDDNKSITDFFSSNLIAENNNNNNNYVNINNEIKRNLVVLAAKDGLSFSQICSTNLWKLIYCCMNLAQKETLIENEALIKIPNRQTISDYVKTEAGKEKQLLHSMREEYATLSFDGGIFSGKSFFIGTISFPYKMKSPMLVTFKEGIKTQEQMALACADTINTLHSNIQVTNIVTDGLLHQVEAMNILSNSKLDNFRNHLNFADPIPYYLPDIPHLFQLSLTHAKTESSLGLAYLITNIDRIASYVRTPNAVSFIGTKCPTYPNTRFFYIVLLMVYILKHKEVIYNYFFEINHQKPSDEFNELEATLNLIPELLQLLRPMFNTVTYLEGDHVCITEVFSILRHFFLYMNETIKKIKNLQIKKIGLFICNEIFENTLENDYGLYYLTAFALSKQGREEDRVKHGHVSEITSEFSVVQLDYSNNEDFAEKELISSLEKEKISSDEFEIDDDDDSGDFTYFSRNDQNLKEIKRREASDRIKKNKTKRSN